MPIAWSLLATQRPDKEGLVANSYISVWLKIIEGGGEAA